jgi:SAM-dependent methyltransferase
MCSTWDLEIVGGALSEGEVRGKRVLEIGSLDVNGSLRPRLQALGPAEYVGIDIRPGPGVDLVCDAADLDHRFGPDAFDVVISTELLEHARDWKKVVHNFKYVLRPEGVLVVSTRSYGVDFHRHPFDFWRYQRDDFERIFGDLRIEALELDPTDPGLFVKARKAAPFVERDLSDHRLYSILRQRRKREASELDIVFFEIRYRFVRILMDLLPKRYRRAVHERLLR